MENTLNKNIVFESSRLDFVEIDSEYIFFLTTLLINDDEMKYIPNKYNDDTDIKILIETLKKDLISEDRTSYFYIIIEQLRNIPIGIVNIKKLKKENFNQGILGYIIKKEYCGNGYATEASRKIIEYGFETLDLQEITASSVIVNSRSENILNKLKMKKEKIIRNGIIIKDKYYDEVEFSLQKLDKISR